MSRDFNAQASGSPPRSLTICVATFEVSDVFGFTPQFWTELIRRATPGTVRFIRLLNEDGSYQVEGAGVISAAGSAAAAGDANVYRTCLCTLMFEVYYRYLKVGDRGTEVSTGLAPLR